MHIINVMEDVIVRCLILYKPCKDNYIKQTSPSIIFLNVYLIGFDKYKLRISILHVEEASPAKYQQTLHVPEKAGPQNTHETSAEYTASNTQSPHLSH